MKKRSNFIAKFKQLHQDIRKNPQKDDNYVEIAFLIEKRLTELKHQRQKRKFISTVIAANLIILFISASIFFYFHQTPNSISQETTTAISSQPDSSKPQKKINPPVQLSQEDNPKPLRKPIPNKNILQPTPKPESKESSAFRENDYFETLALNSKNNLSNSLSPSDYIFGEPIQISLDANGTSEYNLIIYNNLGDVVAEQIIQVDSTQQLQINLASEKLGLGVFYWFLENELEDFSCKFYIREE